jgi:nucleotide-binding universal stress UspA family protein
MKTILVPTSGSVSDYSVFETALAAARLVDGHLEFLHLRLAPEEAALHTPHVEFARGPAIGAAMARLREESVVRAVGALQHVEGFCERQKIAMADAPRAAAGVTASWSEASGDAMAQLLCRARYDDLVVMGRHARADGLPEDLLEQVLVGCGRPVLIATGEAGTTLGGTGVVAWKDTPEAARALSAAMPLLARLDRVVVITVAESRAARPEAAAELARQLAWHGIRAEGRALAAEGRSAAERLESAAIAMGAGLIVMGGYGRGRSRELIFGGCTQSMIEGAKLPVLMLH